MNILEYNSVFYKMVKSVCNITEFAKSMLHNYIKVVRLKPDQPNQWLRACSASWITTLKSSLFCSTEFLYGSVDVNESRKFFI